MKVPRDLQKRIDAIVRARNITDDLFDLAEVLSGTREEVEANIEEVMIAVDKKRPGTLQRRQETKRREASAIEEEWRRSGNTLASLGISREEYPRRRGDSWLLMKKYKSAGPEERALMERGCWRVRGSMVYVEPHLKYGTRARA